MSTGIALKLLMIYFFIFPVHRTCVVQLLALRKVRNKNKIGNSHGLVAALDLAYSQQDVQLFLLHNSCILLLKQQRNNIQVKTKFNFFHLR